MTKYWILSLLIVFGIELNAQQAMTLKDCIEYGLINHKSTVIYQNEIAIAQAKSHEVVSGYLPSVVINGGIDDNLKVQETIIPAGLLGPTDTKVAFTKQFSTNVSAQLDQTIYDQALITNIKGNKFTKEKAVLDVQKNNETIIYNISTTYYQTLVYQEQMNLLKSNCESFKQQLDISKLQLDKGIVTELDYNKIQVSYNNSNSQALVAENNLTLSLNQLKNEMGYPLETPLQIENISPALSIESMTKVETNSFTASRLLDYQLLALNISKLENEQRGLSLSIMPKLSAYARYGQIGYGDNLNQSFNTLNDFSSVGLKLSIPIFSGMKKSAQYKQTKYNRLNAIENMKIEKDGLELKYKNALTKLEQAQSRLNYDKINVTLAQEVFHGTDLQYQKGVTNLTDWLNAQNSLKEAQTNYLNSLYNYLQARIEFANANGTLNEFPVNL